MVRAYGGTCVSAAVASGGGQPLRWTSPLAGKGIGQHATAVDHLGWWGGIRPFLKTLSSSHHRYELDVVENLSVRQALWARGLQDDLIALW